MELLLHIRIHLGMKWKRNDCLMFQLAFEHISALKVFIINKNHIQYRNKIIH